MMRPRLSNEEQRQVDRATAEIERRVETLDALAAMEKRALASEATIAEAKQTHMAIHTAWVNSHDEWLKAIILEQTDRFDNLAAAPSAAIDAHDAQVKAEALDEAADWLETFISGYTSETPQTRAGRDMIYLIRDRAAEIRKAAQ